jgi:hypothetical protein
MHNSLSYVFIFRFSKLKRRDALSLLRLMQFQTEAISLVVDSAARHNTAPTPENPDF